MLNSCQIGSRFFTFINLLLLLFFPNLTSLPISSYHRNLYLPSLKGLACAPQITLSSAMELDHLLHKAINLVLTPLVFAIICLILPFLIIFRLVVSISSRFSSENMARKVVLITGASSGIGEVDPNPTIHYPSSLLGFLSF